MGPGKRRFWFPVVRLGAFFGAVVVVGNLILQATFAAETPESETGRSIDYIGRRKRQIEKRLRSFERLFIGPGRDAPSDGGGAFHLVEPVVEDAALPASLATPEPAPLVWPSVPEPPSRLPVELSSIEPLLTPEFVAEFYRFGASDPVGEMGNALLRGPEALLDGILRLASDLFPRSGNYALPYDNAGGVTERLLDFEIGARGGPIFTEFMGHLAEREQRFFLRFAGSGLDTPGVEEGTEDVDAKDVMREQGKILWDALRKTYFSKYKFRGEDRIRDDAFYFNEWRGADFAVIPPLIAGYLYYRGIEKRVSMGDTWLRFSVEPLSRWATGKDDMAAGVSLEWGIKGFPVALIVSAGRYDGKAELDFIGIGTSVGMARKALALQRGD